MGGVTYGNSIEREQLGGVHLLHAITTDRAELAGHRHRSVRHRKHRGETAGAVADRVPMVAPTARIGQIGKLLYIHRF
jgi:hypothetical protein